MDALTDIGSLDRDGIAELVAASGQATYRTRQLVWWLYARGAARFEDMSDLPADFRTSLAEHYFVGTAEATAVQRSSDGTRKYLVRFPGGVSVETVGLPEKGRLTVCFSTQAGCAMGCTFCATGRSGFVRDLSAGEMVRQVMLVSRDFGSRVTNAVAMGQGEPFANYDSVLGALRFMNADDGLGIGARHLTVSTCGLLAGIRRFSGEPEQFTLAVSLHSAVSATRRRLMPGVRGVSLTSLRHALVEYAGATGRRPTLEYALIEGVNDTPAELEALVAFARGLLVHVNLIPVNPVEGAGLKRAAAARARAFADTLAAVGIEASIRAERGADIDAACGQLRQHADEAGTTEP